MKYGRAALICFILVFGFEVCWAVREVFIGKLVFDVVLGLKLVLDLERW